MRVTPIEGEGLVRFHCASESQKCCPRCRATFGKKHREACPRCFVQVVAIEHLVDLSVKPNGQCSCQYWNFHINPKKTDEIHCKHIKAARETLANWLLETYLKRCQEGQCEKK